MRPVDRRNSPRATDYADHRDAFWELASRLGFFCSYCERRIATVLAVEHIQPKGLPAYEHLKGRWENFLLACVNCNSTKKDKDVVLNQVLLPDRDSTAAAYTYTMDGRIEVQPGLSAQQRAKADRTLALTGLDKLIGAEEDSNGKLVAGDRVSQRMEAWLIAQDCKTDLQVNQSDAFRRLIGRTAKESGFFSIWMTVFQDDLAVRRLLVEAFDGTAPDCFDPLTTLPVTPRPANGLADGSKV